jgi:Secretion system C-terminal sorting domain
MPETFPVSLYCLIRNNDKKQVITKELENSKPKVLYDFNLKIGDTIFNGSYCGSVLIISQIDSIQICGKFHKRFKTQYNIIALTEGIGINQCLFQFQSCIDVAMSGCYTELENDSCKTCDLLLNLPKDLYLSDELKIFPNPGNSKLFISDSKVIRKIFICSILGQPGYCNTWLNSTTAEIDIRSFSAGIYLIKIEFSNKSAKIKPFIKN